MTIGHPQNRIDGPAKVTGQARYTADVPVENLAHAVLVTSTVPKGMVTGIDISEAQAQPGVLRVFTYENTPRFLPVTSAPMGERDLPLQGPTISYEGQVVTLVVADSLENASEAARRIRIDYRSDQFVTDYLSKPKAGEPLNIWLGPVDQHIGDVPAALAAAESRVHHVYETADRHHNAMEPSATIASWEDGQLTVYDAAQGLSWVQAALSQAFGLDPAIIRIRTDYVGGGFGAKGYVWPRVFLAVMAARELRRPVKLVLTRAQSFTAHGYQAASRQTVALAARRDGMLTGIRHQVVNAGSTMGDNNEPAAVGTRLLYACPSIETSHRAVRVDRGNPTPMRAPLEGVGLAALEIAMDELAYELGIDPLELRLRNYAETDPSEGRSFSSKKLRECYLEGARRFGWSDRNLEPGSMRDGRDLIGWGTASALMQAFRRPARARITINDENTILVESATQELGGGTYTVLAQIAADALGLPIGRVRVSIGDTSLPEGPVSAGSSVTLSAGSAVQDAAVKLRQVLSAAGASSPADYQDALKRLGRDMLSAEGAWSPPAAQDGERGPAMYTFGAVFAEVRLDEDIPIPRVSRVVGVYSAGRIINPKTARSQMTGGIIWGIGQALLEKSEMDHQLGRFLSKNFAGTLIPVNADIPDIDVAFIEEFDGIASPIGAKGIGELGGVGIGPAIANAVFHATGKRVRSYPVRPEMLLG